MNATDFLTGIRGIMKLHESMLKEIGARYHLTMIEANIISFLHNNPGRDTAGDIVELRMLSKGNVSLGVESLIQKGILKRSPDDSDRRKIHLSLLSAAKPITDDIDAVQRQFQEEVFGELSEQERLMLEQMTRRIVDKTKSVMMRRKLKE